MLYLLFALAIVVGVAIYLMKKGKIKDSDGDLIPDAVEDTVEEVKHRAKRVKEEFDDVVEEVKDVVEQAGDIPAAVTGKTRRGRKPSKSKSGGSVKKKPVTTQDSKKIK